MVDSRVFAALPGLWILLLPQEPMFPVVAISDEAKVALGTIDINPVDNTGIQVLALLGNTAGPTIQDLLLDAVRQCAGEKKRVRIQTNELYMPLPPDDPTYRYEWILAPVINDDGEIQSVLVTVLISPATANGKVETEGRRNALESAAAFFMSAPVIIGYVRGPDYIIEFANPGLLEVWGRGPEVIGMPLTTAIPELEGQGFTELLDEVCRSGAPFHASAYPIRLNRTGTEDTYYFDFIYTPFYGDGPGVRPTGVIAVGYDVTPQVKARMLAEEGEAILQRKVDERTADLTRIIGELEQSNQNLERFAYAASHDLKAPVRKIELFSSRLFDRLQHTLSAIDQRDLGRIVGASRRMTSLIDDLLRYAHASSGALLDETVNLNECLHLILDDLDHDIEEKKATIHCDNLPMLKGNARQLQQLFYNLLTNALKYSRPQIPPVIEVRYRMSTAGEVAAVLPFAGGGRNFHWIEVRDNGIGFDQTDAQRIFQVFTRLQDSGGYTGTGIGLSIAHKVAENHHGFMYATSTKGEGAIFHVVLPADNFTSDIR